MDTNDFLLELLAELDKKGSAKKIEGNISDVQKLIKKHIKRIQLKNVLQHLQIVNLY